MTFSSSFYDLSNNVLNNLYTIFFYNIFPGVSLFSVLILFISLVFFYFIYICARF